MKIILSSGGTLGPVAPLLAIAEVYRKKYPDVQFIWVGTKNGPEHELVAKYQIPFFVIAAGKWRRYYSWHNIFDLVNVLMAFVQSLFFLWRQKPNLLISAGGFVSVPLHWTAMLLGIRTWVHQQDVRPGLANRLMALGATKMTVAIKESLKYFPRAEWIGNPVRDLKVENYLASKAKFNIPEKAITILAMGGGTGSIKINQMVVEALGYWPTDWQVIHLVGKERPKESVANAVKLFSNYHAYEFLAAEIKDAYAAADVVISRAGFASLTELSALKKAAIVIPMPDTHQEDNARYLSKEKAVIYLDQRITTGLKLSKIVSDLVTDVIGRELMTKRLNEILPPAKEEKILEITEALLLAKKVGK